MPLIIKILATVLNVLFIAYCILHDLAGAKVEPKGVTHLINAFCILNLFAIWLN